MQVDNINYYGLGTGFCEGTGFLINKRLQGRVNLKLTLLFSFINQMLTSADRNIRALGYINTTGLSESLVAPSQDIYENTQVKQQAE